MDNQSVDVLFLDTITHIVPKGTPPDKIISQDEIQFTDPVKVELLRIPHNNRNLYAKLTSETQKQPIKSFEVYYRNLKKKSARFDSLICSSSELLTSSTSDILIPIKEPIFTDLLVIRGNFITMSLCVYGKVIVEQSEIQEKCPYFKNDVDFEIENVPKIAIERNVFEQSRSLVKSIKSEYEEGQGRLDLSLQQKFNDSYLHEQQIENIRTFSANLFEETQITSIRKKLQDIQTHLIKLFKSSHIGLYYPSGHRNSSIPDKIPKSIIQILVQMLSLDLSDQFRALEVLKMLLQLKDHAKLFVDLGGLQCLIRLFVDFFSPSSVIFSSLKSLLIEVIVVVSFWDFGVQKIVVCELHEIIGDGKFKEIEGGQNKEKKGQVSRQRSRDKKKKRERSSSYSRSVSKKKSKKSKKNKDKDKDRKKGKSSSRVKERKEEESQKNKEVEANLKAVVNTRKYYEDLKDCTFYQSLFRTVKNERNIKIINLLKILIEQATQTLTKDEDLSLRIAKVTPLLRDTKYMFMQGGGQMIGSKPMKLFSSFKPFLNEEQSKGVKCSVISDKQKIKNPQQYGINCQVLKMIDSAISVMQAKGEQVENENKKKSPTPFEGMVHYDEQFLTLLSELVSENTNGMECGINYFIDALKLGDLAVIKKNEAIVALLFEYIYQVLLESNDYTVVYYMDKIFDIMLIYVRQLDGKDNNSANRTSKQQKNCSKELMEKMKYLINLALPYNAFNGSESSFKGLSETFTKLLGYEHFQINKISAYTQKQYCKASKPTSFSTLTNAFNLGNFVQLGTKQYLLQIYVCLKFFLVLLKFNRNIWTTFYDNKLVSAFSSLYLKIHSILKFFLTPSIQRQNAISEMKEHERIIESYLRVGQNLTQIFIEKAKYESAFNELTEEDDIFERIQLYEKFFDTYVFLVNANSSNDCMINKTKIKQKIEIVLAHIIEIFDTVLFSYEISKHSSRQSKINYFLKYIYRIYFESINNRAATLAFLTDLVHFSGPHTMELFKNFFTSTISQREYKMEDLFLPKNQKPVLESLIRKNIYRSDPFLVSKLVKFLQVLIQKQETKEIAFSILHEFLYDSKAHMKEEIEETNLSELTIKKMILLVNLIALVGTGMNQKLDDAMMMMLKFINGLRSSPEKGQEVEFQKLKLKNFLISYFYNAFKKDGKQQLFTQFLRISSTFLNADEEESPHFRLQQLKLYVTILKVLNQALTSCFYQSIFLYGEYVQVPTKAEPLLSLSKIFNIFNIYIEQKQLKLRDEQEESILQELGVTAFYTLCKLTTIDSIEFYSTESRKNAINTVAIGDKKFSITDIISCMENIAPKQMVFLLKNYLDFPIREKPQALPSEPQAEEKKSIGKIFSKSVFSMISENDPIGKARFQFVQDTWLGGDTNTSLFKLKERINYREYIAKKNQIESTITQSLRDIQYTYQYKGIHPKKTLNKLFILKLKKNFLMKKMSQIEPSEIIMKNNIPEVIMKPEEPKKMYNPESTKNIPNRNIPQLAPVQPSLSPNLARGASNTSNNRSPSPYNPNPNPYPPSTDMNYPPYQNKAHMRPPVHSQMNNIRMNPPMNTNTQYGNLNPMQDPRYGNNSGNGGFYPGSNQHFNQRMPMDPRDHHSSNFPPPPPPPVGYNNYPNRGGPPYNNMNMGYNIPNSGYINPNYGYNNPQYPVNPVNSVNPGYPGANGQEMLIREIWNKLNYLKNNPNDLVLKKQVEDILTNKYIAKQVKELMDTSKNNQ